MSALFAIKRDWQHTKNYVDKQVLSFSDNNELDLDSVDRVSYLRPEFTVKSFNYCKNKNLSLYLTLYDRRNKLKNKIYAQR